MLLSKCYVPLIPGRNRMESLNSIDSLKLTTHCPLIKEEQNYGIFKLKIIPIYKNVC